MLGKALATKYTVTQLTCKVLVCGDGGVGKTTYMQRLRTGEFNDDFGYIPTMGVNVHPLQIRVHNFGKVVFNCWDTAGQDEFKGLRDGYYAGAGAAIIMFDVKDRKTYDNVSHWLKDIRNVCPNIPIVLCGNKAATEDDKFVIDAAAGEIGRLQYYDVCVETNFNIKKPLLYLCRELTGQRDCEIVIQQEVPVRVDEALQAEYERQLNEANKVQVGPHDNSSALRISEQKEATPPQEKVYVISSLYCTDCSITECGPSVYAVFKSWASAYRYLLDCCIAEERWFTGATLPDVLPQNRNSLKKYFSRLTGYEDCMYGDNLPVVEWYRDN